MRCNIVTTPLREEREKCVISETACDPSAFDGAAPRPKLHTGIITLVFGLARTYLCCHFNSSFERVCHC